MDHWHCVLICPVMKYNLMQLSLNRLCLVHHYVWMCFNHINLSLKKYVKPSIHYEGVKGRFYKFCIRESLRILVIILHISIQYMYICKSQIYSRSSKSRREAFLQIYLKFQQIKDMRGRASSVVADQKESM